jgi:hypothetical protein
MERDAGWHPYDAQAVAELGMPAEAAAALTGPGLPAHGIFTRTAERELTVAELPECGRAAYLAQAFDGFFNTYWLKLDDGSVWMRYGVWDEPEIDHVLRVNSSVGALQGVLRAFCAFEDRDDALESDVQAYEDAVIRAIVGAVAADPAAFEHENAWWALTFEELEYTIARIPAGEKSFYELVRQDESGEWVFDHPGYEDEDEDGDEDD